VLNNAFFVATSLTEQEKVFERWCYCFNKTYSNQAEKMMRFGIFQKALSEQKPIEELRDNSADLADLTKDEMIVKYHWCSITTTNYVCPSDFDQMPSFARLYRQPVRTFLDSEDECWDEVYWDEECSDLESDQDDQQSFDGTL
jgi:hypothetical protein